MQNTKAPLCVSFNVLKSEMVDFLNILFCFLTDKNMFQLDCYLHVDYIILDTKTPLLNLLGVGLFLLNFLFNLLEIKLFFYSNIRNIRKQVNILILHVHV